MEILLLGAAAGITTTVAGMGGGLLMTLALAVLYDPLAALVITSPALLVGNAHRALMYRAHIDGPTVRPLLLGAVPGSLVGGLLATGAPAPLVSTMMVLMTVLALGRSTGKLRWRPPRSSIAPVSALAGVVNATAGGAGVLLGPLLLSRGLTGTTYISTMAASAVAMHLTRLGAYSLGGAVELETMVLGLQLAVALIAGNMFGHRLRQHLSERSEARIQAGVMLTTVSLALLGLEAVLAGGG